MRGVWAIDPRHAAILLPHAIDYLEGKYKPSAYHDDDDDGESLEEQNRKRHATFFIDSSTGMIAPKENNSFGLIAVMPVWGSIMKQDMCGEPGTATMGNQLKAFANDPAVKSVILHCDTPGGAVDG